MRLGSWPCKLVENSFAYRAYESREIHERHRHRYEFNREYEERLKAAGLRITGETPDGTYVEICELADHPWFLGCQFHPNSVETYGAASAFSGVYRRVVRESPAPPDAVLSESQPEAMYSRGD